MSRGASSSREARNGVHLALQLVQPGSGLAVDTDLGHLGRSGRHQALRRQQAGPGNQLLDYGNAPDGFPSASQPFPLRQLQIEAKLAELVVGVLSEGQRAVGQAVVQVVGGRSQSRLDVRERTRPVVLVRESGGDDSLQNARIREPARSRVAGPIAVRDETADGDVEAVDISQPVLPLPHHVLTRLRCGGEQSGVSASPQVLQPVGLLPDGPAGRLLELAGVLAQRTEQLVAALLMLSKGCHVAADHLGLDNLYRIEGHREDDADGCGSDGAPEPLLHHDVELLSGAHRGSFPCPADCAGPQPVTRPAF